VGLTFYNGAGSPFAWRVFLALEHKQLPYERVTLSFAKREMQTPEYLRINQRGKVPALRDGEFTLYESAAILEYLDDRYPDAPRLFPADLQERALVRRLVREIDNYAGQAVSTLGKHVFRSAGTERSAYELGAIEHAAQTLRDEAAFFEPLLAGEFLVGVLSAADLSLYPLFAMIARFELRSPDLDVSPHLGPRVRAWMRTIEALPYFETTFPEHWRAG
jgi:glutathione S-transferase